MGEVLRGCDCTGTFFFRSTRLAGCSSHIGWVFGDGALRECWRGEADLPV